MNHESITSRPSIKLNCKWREYMVPVPPDIYQYVQEHMQHPTLNELKWKLKVSRWNYSVFVSCV